MAPGAAGRRRLFDRYRAPDQRPLPVAAGAGRRCARSCARCAEAGARSRAHACAVRGPGAARCRLRHIRARPSRELDSDHVSRHRRGWHHDGRRRMDGACAGAGHAVGSCHCTRRDRRAAGRRGSQRHSETAAAAASPARNTSRREPAERRKRADDLSHRRARGCIGRAGFRYGRADVVAGDRRQCVRGISARALVHAADARHYRCAELDRAAIRGHLRRVDSRRASASVRDRDGRRLRNHGGARRTAPGSGAQSPAVVCSVGPGRVRSERARVRADRLAASPDPGCARPRATSRVFQDRRHRAGHRHRRAIRVGVQLCGRCAAETALGSAPADGRARPSPLREVRSS